ncbi:hypothetical protein AMTR_s00001p00259020 [Amborella trichopoda]|uniref:Uncharacterized protein n=1 Tax=Amborella trichopoda TaxID=13333 RepID=W1NLT9_AMBTC|nr:hypothetical protein AMTR_s00001p00259020 [Amborella trichopoda]
MAAKGKKAQNLKVVEGGEKVGRGENWVGEGEKEKYSPPQEEEERILCPSLNMQGQPKRYVPTAGQHGRLSGRDASNKVKSGILFNFLRNVVEATGEHGVQEIKHDAKNCMNASKRLMRNFRAQAQLTG